MELTIEQSELLFEATEIFLLWYEKYYSEPPTFSELLQISHTKIMDICELGNYTDEEVTQKIKELKENYFKLLTDY